MALFVKASVRRFWLVLFCVINLGSSPFALSKSQNELAGELRVIIYGFFRGNLNPIKTYNPYELSVISCSLRRLTRIDEKGHVTGDLAQSWTVSADGTRYEFTLDGDREVTARDVKRAIMNALSPDSEILHKEILKSLFGLNGRTRIRTPSDRKIVFSLKHPYPAFLFLLTSPELSIPAHSEQEVAPPKGSGPYLMESRRANKEIILRKKIRGLGAYSKIDIEVIDDIKLVVDRIRKGDVDLVLGLPISETKNIPIASSLEMINGRFANPSHLQFNNKKPIFKDKEFRHDLAGFILGVAREWGANQRNLKFHPHLLPPGLLPPAYYLEQNYELILPSVFSKKWGRIIDAYGLRIWLNSSYNDFSFSNQLISSFAGVSRRVETTVAPLRSVTPNIEAFDIVVADGGMYFPDPDSALVIWSKTLPAFPFAGKALLDGAEKIRYLKDPDLRAKKYMEEVRRFEREYWVAPLFNVYDPIIKRTNLEIPDNMLRPFDVICDSIMR